MNIFDLGRIEMKRLANRCRIPKPAEEELWAGRERQRSGIYEQVDCM
jgi:hypothetical protein